MAKKDPYKSKQTDDSELQGVRDTYIIKAMKRMKIASEAEEHNRKDFIEDMKFINGQQWDTSTKNDRDLDGRPSLVINTLPGLVEHIIGDIRLNRPQIKTRPAGGKTSIVLAKIFDAIIRNIEYESDAEQVYDNAAESMIAGGLGGWRINTCYADDAMFEQRIVIEWIPNPLSMYFDPKPFDLDKQFAEWAFITSWLKRDEFMELYPNITPMSIPTKGKGDTDGWFEPDRVKIAEYWERIPVEKTLCQLTDGSVMYQDKAEELIAKQQMLLSDSQSPLAQISAPLEIIKDRKVDTYQVKRSLICGTAKLEEPADFPCSIIPIVPIYGKCFVVEGKRYYRGMVRFAKDPARMYNYFRSAETEFIALQPKTPWLATPTMIEGFENRYKDANKKNISVLPFNIDPMNVSMKPERQPPPQASPGMFQAGQEAREDIKATTNMYDPSLGIPGPERTGPVINARLREGDVANFPYADNLARGLKLTGKILVDMIPRVIDTEQLLHLKAHDEEELEVPVNKVGTDPETGLPIIINNLTAGKLSVIIDTGPSFSTARVEAREGMEKFAMGFPEQAPYIADLVAKSQDWPYAQEISERLEKMLPPMLQKPKNGKQPQAQPTPKQLSDQAKLETAKTKTQREKLKLAKDALDLQHAGKGKDTDVKKIVLDVLSQLLGQTPSDGAPQQGG